jgi:uncharacterized protein (TIGR03083 family)
VSRQKDGSHTEPPGKDSIDDSSPEPGDTGTVTAAANGPPAAPETVLTGHLFRPLHRVLIGLLRSLTPEHWARPATAGGWMVRDVAAHLLDGDLRRISVDRDAHPPPAPAGGISGYDELVTWLDALNADWVAAARRMSPRMLTDLLEHTGIEAARLMEATDPLSEATFPVAWAGHQASPAWLDVGREYTERWHHQDQIRDAVGAEPLAAPEWLRPVLAISLRALPRSYAALSRPAGTTIALAVDGAAGGRWSLTSDGARWQLSEGGAPASPACRITMDDLTLARLLLHRLPRDLPPTGMVVAGDAELAGPLRRARAVMVPMASGDE